MRIVFTGAHGTGKTTLLNELRPEFEKLDYRIETSVSRYVKKLGLKINEAGDDDTQNLIMAIMAQNALIYPNLVSDRCIIDTLMYSRYMYDRGSINSETMLKAEITADKIKPLYDLIFWLRPEFEIEDDGLRSVDKEFQKDMDEYFHDYIRSNHDITWSVFQLSGSVEERLENIHAQLDRIGLKKDKE